MAQCTGDNQRGFGGGPLPHVSVDWPSTQAWSVISGVANHTGDGRSFHGFITLSTSPGHWWGKEGELLLLAFIPIYYPVCFPVFLFFSLPFFFFFGLVIRTTS